MDTALFKGLGVAVVTPFTNNNDFNNEVDYDALKKIIQHLLSGGVDYLVALGTTAEIPTLTEGEQLKIIDCFVKVIDHKVSLVIGIGGNNTASIIQQIKNFEQLSSYQGILSVSPYYNKPSQQALFYHYEAIAKSTNKPIILYNVPARTGSNIEAATTIKLAQSFNNIIGIKEASGNLNQVMQIIANRPNNFLVISGDDALTIPIISLGGDGLISVIANAFPKHWAKIIKNAMNNKYELATSLLYKHLNILEAIYREGNPTGIKCVLNNLGLCQNELRLPLIKASEKLQQEIVDRINILE